MGEEGGRSNGKAGTGRRLPAGLTCAFRLKGRPRMMQLCFITGLYTDPAQVKAEITPTVRQIFAHETNEWFNALNGRWNVCISVLPCIG